MENILNVAFEGKKVAYAEGLTQWDKGWTLKVTGIEDITDSVEVHFSLDEAGGEAKRALATVENGILTVGIANFILEAADIINYNAYAFIYPVTAEKAKTVRKIVFFIKARPKPADYVQPEELGLIEELKEQVNKKANKATTLEGYGINNAYTKEETDKNLKLKVDKVENKDLSTNDFTDKYKKQIEINTQGMEVVAERTELLYSIALGATQGIVFNNYQEMIEYFNVNPTIDLDGNGTNLIELNVGQPVLIGTVDVPDLWVASSVDSEKYNPYIYISDEKFVDDLSNAMANGNFLRIGYYTFGQLETQKVNLAEYSTTEQMNTAIQSAISDVLGGAS